MARFAMLTIPSGKRENVIQILDDEDIEYSVTDETSGREFDCSIHFALPTNAVEPLLDRFRDLGLEDDAITVILETQTVISREFDELKERYEEEEESPEQIAREELQTAAEDLVPSSLGIYGTMTIVSAIIATAGLLLDSAAVVVGSMVIAPLIGPAMATSTGTVLRDSELFREGIKLQALGLLVSIVGSTLFATLIKTAHLVPPGLEVLTISQVQERLRPDVLSLVVALGSGAAGVISLASGLSSALVGVMIAVALIPPAATVGIGIAWSQFSLVLGSSILLLVNVFSINLAALLILWYLGYRPAQWFQIAQTRETILKRAGILVAIILFLSLFLGTVTYKSYRSATTVQLIRNKIQTLVESESHPKLSLLNVKFDYTANLLSERPSSATVLIGASPSKIPTNLGQRLDTVVDRMANRNVDVQVRYIIVQQPE